MAIVGAATKLEVSDRWQAADAERLDVVQLEKPPLLASPAVGGDERATPTVPRPDHPTDMSGDVP